MEASNGRATDVIIGQNRIQREVVVLHLNLIVSMPFPWSLNESDAVLMWLISTV